MADVMFQRFYDWINYQVVQHNGKTSIVLLSKVVGGDLNLLDDIGAQDSNIVMAAFFLTLPKQ